MKVLESEGVTFYLNSGIVSAKDLGSEKVVVTKTKEGKTKSVKAEQILVALGRKPNLEDLGLEDISLKFDKKGIKVDSRLRTNHKHIHAAGDVTGAYQFTHAAGYEGGVVLSNAILHLPKKAVYTYLPWCTYTDPELASIGMNEKSAESAGIKYSVWTEEFKSNDRSLAEGEEIGKIKMILNEKEKPVGVQILGPHAGELISEWVAVMNGGYQAWVNAGYPICAGEAVSSSGSFVPRPQPGMILETREIESGGRSDILLIDVRERDRFLGVSEPIDSIAGRIPGAVNHCYLDDLDSDRFLRESGDIRSRWQEILGDRPPDSVACMCGSGVTACLSLLAMEVAGLGGARLYAGSWSEWITDCRRPVVTGPGHLSRG